MRGEFIAVWNDTWKAIWAPLTDSDDVEQDVFCEIYRELSKSLTRPASLEDLADIIDNTEQSTDALRNTRSEDIVNEQGLIDFFEELHQILSDFGGDPLANHYYLLLEGFVTKYSLRYELRRPCTLCPTLPGIFASLVRDLKVLTSLDAHLHKLMLEFETAVRDLRDDKSDVRIKTCIQKQFNLLEAIGMAFPGVRGNTLGRICDQVGTWPHAKIKLAMQNLYGFASDYPGIRHGGSAGSVLRDVDMRDLVAMTVLLTGFTPYLLSNLVADDVFGGGIRKRGPLIPNTSPHVPVALPVSNRWSRLVVRIRQMFLR